MATTTVEDLCRQYLARLESGDLESLLELFADDATATSPICGTLPVREFYSYVMRVTSDRRMSLRTIYLGATDDSRVAMHLDYTRTVADGSPATIEVVDLLRLTDDRSRFASILIVYDTAPVRAEFDRPGAR